MNVKISKEEKKFQDNINSFYKTKEKSWSGNIKSNAMWQKGWKEYNAIEEKK